MIIAISAATLSPLYLKITELHNSLAAVETKFEKHQDLKLHPVGESRVNALENSIQGSLNIADKKISDLGNRVQRESDLTRALINSNLQELKNQFEDVKQNGSPATRERLSVIEEKMKSLGK